MESDWELTILDAEPLTAEMGGVAAGDLDGDGNVEIVIGGLTGPHWYRPATRERGVIDGVTCHVGMALEDVDGDGRPEAVFGANRGRALYWYKPGKDLRQPWEEHLIDHATVGGTHDIVFGDIDGDGERELVVDSVYCDKPGVYAYKRGADPKEPWRKVEVSTGLALEGTAIADLDGDGRAEIICGPDYFKQPAAGPFSGHWERRTYAPSHREMCRVKAIDITGNGRPDIVIVDSEYMDGRLVWMENRLLEDPDQPWIEHELEPDMIYAHTLAAWRDQKGIAHILVGEMPQGGWGAPANRHARLIEFTTGDGGKTWRREVVSHGEGTHEAIVYDIDGDGELEIVGKDPYDSPYGKCRDPRVHFWKRAKERSPIRDYRHRLIDRDKPSTGVDIFGADVDGDGAQEIVTGRWWYRVDTGERHEIPGICQAIAAYDIDGDGRVELIGIKPRAGETHFYNQLTSDLVWLKPLDAGAGKWEEHAIGVGRGDWPHGSVIAPLLPGGKLAMVTGYHDATPPEILEIRADPRRPWSKRLLADIPYGEEFVARDIDGDGKLDLVAGSWWLENLGDGRFQPHVICEGFKVARVAVADFNGDGRPDILVGEEIMDFGKRVIPRSRLAWFENPTDPRKDPWTVHVIDKVRCAHSVAAADLDGDGLPEAICGEHDPFWPYRSMGSVYVYKKTDPQGLAWKRYRLDNRFEHHDGTKTIDLGNGRTGILSHGWQDSLYVHLWEPPKK